MVSKREISISSANSAHSGKSAVILETCREMKAHCNCHHSGDSFHTIPVGSRESSKLCQRIGVELTEEQSVMMRPPHVILVLLICSWPPSRCAGEAITVIDGYTHNSTLTSGDSVPLGTQIILVCRVVGLPYGTPLSYNWTCPNGPCEVEGYLGKAIHKGNILAVNTTAESDGGTYHCLPVTAGVKLSKGNFSLGVKGGRVVHSYGRLIPHHFPITDLQQISGPDGWGRINCTVSSGTAWFGLSGHDGRLTDHANEATVTLVVDPINSRLTNKEVYCVDQSTNLFYLFPVPTESLTAPNITVTSATSTTVKYVVDAVDKDTQFIIAQYRVHCFGVLLLGECVSGGTHSTITISPAVPGARYRITAWALGDGGRSATPTVENIVTEGAIPSAPRLPLIIRVDTDGIELSWLPPTEPNGEVHYVIYYTPEGGTERSTDTGSNLTHYNLTGLERNRAYNNIAVQAVNSIGGSERRVVSSNDVSPSATLQSSGYNVSPSSSSLTENDLLRSQQIDSSTSAGLEQPVMSTAEQGTSAETGPEVSTPVYSVTVENSEKISNSLLGLNQSTIIGIATGAVGVVVLVLLVVCGMLLAIAAKPKRTRRQLQQAESSGRDSGLLHLTSTSTLSYYDDAEAVATAMKAITADTHKRTQQKRWTASDNVYEDSTRGSYVSVVDVLDVKWSERGDRDSRSTDETVETYEDMSGANLDTIRSQMYDRLCKLDESWDTYEEMDTPMALRMLRDMKRLQGVKGLHTLDEGWEEGMGCIPMYYDSFEDTYNSDELNDDAALDAQSKEQPKSSQAVGNCDVYDVIYDDIVGVEEMYDKVGKATDEQVDKWRGGKTDGQTPKLPTGRTGRPLAKQQVNWSAGRPTQQPGKQAVKSTTGLSSGQQESKIPDRLAPGKPPAHYQALCPPPMLADIRHQYTRLRPNQGHQAQKTGRPPSLQYSSVRETSRRAGVAGEMTVRPPSHQYSSLRKPSHKTSAAGEDRPPSHQYSSVTEPPHRNGENEAPEYLQYI